MKFLTIMVVLSLITGCSNQVDQHSHPHIDTVAPFYSAKVLPRRVDVWLPRQYRSNPQQRFPVLYLQDGQNLFNHSDATLGIAWDLDRIAQRLIDKKKIKPVIIVAIWNSPRREQEYFPISAFKGVTDGVGSRTLADEYLGFIVDELKPYIDRHYATASDPSNTFIAGSDKGALISLYALTEYPDIFGGAACIANQSRDGLFNAISATQVSAFNRYLENKLPDAAGRRLYFSLGTRYAHPLYMPYSLERLLQKKGYQRDSDLLITKTPGAEDDDSFWQVGADKMLSFLLDDPASVRKPNQ